MPNLANIVFQSTSVVGNGNAELIDVAGFRAFETAFPLAVSPSVLFPYIIRHTKILEWEVGNGYINGAGELVRHQVLESSNGGSKVVFSVGIKEVINDAPASVQEELYNIGGQLAEIETDITNLQTGLNLKAPIASPTFTGTVTLPAGQVVNGVTLSASGAADKFLNEAGVYASAGGGAPAFNTITSGTNTTAAMVIGSGSSLAASGTGTITATAMPATGLTGTLQAAQFPALTGEATTSAGSLAVTLTNSSVIGKVLTGFAAGAGTVAATDTILQAFQKIVGNIAALVTGVSSVFGRSGAVIAQSGDYTTALVTESGNLYFTDERAQDAVGSILTDSSRIDFTYNDVSNTITADIVAGSVTDTYIGAGVDAVKIANGSVTNTEFQYLDGVTSGIQAQIDAKGSGTVTAVSVSSANGFAGSSSGGATPALTITTSVTGILKGDSTAISAATAGTDYSAGTAALATGILKSTTTTGALTIAVAGDFPTLNQDTTGSAATLTTARTIGGVSFNGSANIVPQTIQVVDAAADTTTFPMLAGSATGSLQPLTDPGLSYNASTNALTASTFVGSLTGNASTATSAATLTTARTIGGVSFNGSANIVPQTIASVDDTSDTTCFVLFGNASGTVSQQPKTNTALGFNASTGALSATSFVGSLAASSLTGTSLPAGIVTSSITTVGTLTGGSTGAGFTIALGTSTITGDLPFSNIAQVGANTVLCNPTTGTADVSTVALSASNLIGRGSTGNVAALSLAPGIVLSGTVLTPKFVNQVMYSYTTSANEPSCLRINEDGTIPQITEGKQWFSYDYTPAAAGNLIIISGWGYFSLSDIYNGFIGAIFVGGTSNALAASLTSGLGNSKPQRVQADAVYTAVGTSTVTFSFRCGPVNDGKTLYINSNNSGSSVVGGVMTSGFLITEVRP